MTHLAELCRLYVLVTLIAAVAGKSFGMGLFQAAVAELLGVGRTIARGLACAVIAAEAAVAALLLAGGHWARLGAAAACLLFLAFTAIIAAALARRQAVHCNCFGGHGRRLSPLDLVRNATLIAAAGYALLAPAAAATAAPALALLLGLALILFLISAHLADIAALVRGA